MCSYGDGESYQVYVSDSRKARKPHTCDECRRTINSGEAYLWAKGLFEGKWYVHRVCAHCRVGQRWLIENCGGFIHCYLTEEMEEHIDEYRGGQGAAMTFGLARIKKGIERKWQRFDGTGLMRLPTLPMSIEDMMKEKVAA